MAINYCIIHCSISDYDGDLWIQLGAYDNVEDAILDIKGRPSPDDGFYFIQVDYE